MVNAFNVLTTFLHVHFHEHDLSRRSAMAAEGSNAAEVEEAEELAAAAAASARTLHCARQPLQNITRDHLGYIS